jgi:hypothetical protein
VRKPRFLQTIEPKPILQSNVPVVLVMKKRECSQRMTEHQAALVVRSEGRKGCALPWWMKLYGLRCLLLDVRTIHPNFLLWRHKPVMYVATGAYEERTQF